MVVFQLPHVIPTIFTSLTYSIPSTYRPITHHPIARPPITHPGTITPEQASNARTAIQERQF
jgi:hypothetical protein